MSGGEEFEIKTEPIDIKEEWQIDFNQPNVKQENKIEDESETKGLFPPEDLNFVIYPEKMYDTSHTAFPAKDAPKPKAKTTVKKENDETMCHLAPENLNFVKCEPQEEFIDAKENMEEDPLELGMKYSCDVCKKSYASKRALSYHIKSVHEGHNHTVMQ